jgi:hypothetical protein
MTHVIVKTVIKNLLKKRILIGHVGYINLSTEEKCGGVVVNGVKINLDASLVSMFKRMMKLTCLKIRIKLKKIRKSN